MKKRSATEAGFTLIEALLCCGLVALLIGVFRPLIAAPAQMQKIQDTNELKSRISRVADGIIFDLQEGSANTLVYSSNTIRISRTTLDLATLAPTSHSVEYGYLNQGGGKGILWRREDGGTPVHLLRDFEQPSIQVPLLSVDPSNPAIKLITLQGRTSKGVSIRIVRRWAQRGQ